MYKKTFLSIACATFMIGCGSSVEMTTIDGKVADGYLVGVKVFMDMNENGLFDIGEPYTITTQGGSFSLNVPKDNSNHPIIAIVNSNAVDEDNNQPIGKDFKMTAPAGETFISPLTSLVQELIESKSVDIQTATKEIASQLNLTDQEDEILKDYIANNNDRLHNIAKAVIEAKFKVLEDLKQYTKSNVSQNIDLSLGNSADADFSSVNYGYDANSLDSYLNNQVINQLSTITSAVDGISYPTTTDGTTSNADDFIKAFEEALKEAVYNALSNINYDYTNFTQEVKVSEPVVSTSANTDSSDNTVDVVQTTENTTVTTSESDQSDICLPGFPECSETNSADGFVKLVSTTHTQSFTIDQNVKYTISPISNMSGELHTVYIADSSNKECKVKVLDTTNAKNRYPTVSTSYFFNLDSDYVPSEFTVTGFSGNASFSLDWLGGSEGHLDFIVTCEPINNTDTTTSTTDNTVSSTVDSNTNETTSTVVSSIEPEYDPTKQKTLFPGHTPGGWANEYSFVALKEDGTIVTWGESNYGGDSSSVQDKLTNVKAIYSTKSAFAALKEDGTVITWGDSGYGGDSSSVTDKLTNVKEIYPSYTRY